MKAFIFLFLPWIFISSCQNYKSYTVEGKKVFYHDFDDGGGKLKFIVTIADYKTFKDFGGHYGLDKNHVYHRGAILLAADPSTFEALDDIFARDKSHVFFGEKLIYGADPQTFQLIANSLYTKDKNDYYIFESQVHVSDKASFFMFNNSRSFGWAKDKNYYYIKEKKYPLSDYESFTPIGEDYAKDKFQVYYQGSVVRGADPATFLVARNGTAQDKHGEYRDGLRLKDISPR
ncbi:DKNYY domain-containing protein [Pedobacter sp. PWIIR3]